MYVEHSPEIWRDFPELVAGVLAADGITADASVAERARPFEDIAAARLASSPESEFREIRAWRHAFAHMGLKPTRYRCAAESLLRRLRKDGSLPSIHPLIDLCNAISLAFATPIAVFDTAGVADHIEVRRALGGETYLTFSGETEHPDPGEVIFADAAARVHARRWTNRQSRYSAVQRTTSAVLIVAEAMHPAAADDMPRLLAAVASELGDIWSTSPTSATLTAAAPRFNF